DHVGPLPAGQEGLLHRRHRRHPADVVGLYLQRPRHLLSERLGRADRDQAEVGHRPTCPVVKGGCAVPAWPGGSRPSHTNPFSWANTIFSASFGRSASVTITPSVGWSTLGLVTRRIFTS